MNILDNTTESQPSTSKSRNSEMLVITPNQIAQLGLTNQLKTIVETQLQQKKKSKRVSKKVDKKSKVTAVESSNRVNIVVNDDCEKAQGKMSSILKEHLQTMITRHKSSSSSEIIKETVPIITNKQILNTPSNSRRCNSKLSKNDTKTKYYNLVGNCMVKKLNNVNESPIHNQSLMHVKSDNPVHELLVKEKNLSKNKSLRSTDKLRTETITSIDVNETQDLNNENTLKHPEKDNINKFQIVGNELVNLSSTEIESILKNKTPPKVMNTTNSIIDNTACLTKTLIMASKDILYQTIEANSYDTFNVTVNNTIKNDEYDLKNFTKDSNKCSLNMESSKNAFLCEGINSNKSAIKISVKTPSTLKCKDFSNIIDVDKNQIHNDSNHSKKLRVKAALQLGIPEPKREDKIDDLTNRPDCIDVTPVQPISENIETDTIEIIPHVHIPTAQSNGTNTTARTGKKRGRKKKTDVVPIIESEKPHLFTESRRGRKRKQIDYSVLNDNISDIETPSKKQRTVVKSEVTELDVAIKETRNDIVEDTYNERESFAEAPVNSSRQFNAEVPNGSNKQQAVNNIENSSLQLLETQRGWKLKPDNTTESGNISICALCNTVFDESEWIFHKQNTHNNLAWKNGEPPLDLDNQILVKEILTKLRAETPAPLRCDVCGALKKSIPGFLSHWKRCRELHAKGNKCHKLVKKTESISSMVLQSFFSNKDSNNSLYFLKSSVASLNSNSEREVPVGDNEVKCAVCKEILPKVKWYLHKQNQHNNLAWREGDTPLDLHNQTLVMRILTDLYKNKKPLRCEICGNSKKSVLGYLSHKSKCQKTDNEIEAMKVICSLCGKSMLPVSLQRHMDLSHASEVEVVLPDVDKSQETVVHGKRRAANKAIDLIQDIAKEIFDEKCISRFRKIVKNVNFRSVESAISKFSEDIQSKSFAECIFDECDYRSSEHEDLFYHIENCKKRGDDNFTCNFCLTTFNNKHAAQNHVTTFHSNNNRTLVINEFSLDSEFDDKNEEDDEYSDDTDQQHTKKKSLVVPKANQQILFLGKRKKPSNALYSYAYRWTEKFCEENYSIVNIFPEISLKIEDWIPVEPDDVLNYLPRLKHSIETARIKTNSIINPICYEYEWKKFKLFESEFNVEDGTSTVFCGGPVSAMAWVPTPYDDVDADQFLSVSVLPEPDTKYYTTENYKDRGIIQFWNFGPLQNKSISAYQPKLEFCIAHSHGMIWSIEWCPSGGYDSFQHEAPRKLGLMAIACSQSLAYVYTVLYPGQMTGTIFEVQPTFVLNADKFIDLNIGENYFQSTRISWTKARGHQHVAVGYTNGVVAIYDLKTESLLLRSESDVITLKPIQTFKPHIDAVTALVIHYLDNGKRWLLTGSIDRESKLWDLDNISEPLNCCKKFIVTEAVWLTHWLCSVYAYDHGFISGAVSTTINPARDFFGSLSTFMPSNSRVTTLTASEWGNLFIQANDCGEIICGFPDQLLYGYDNDKRKSIKKSRCLASYTGMVAKSIPCAKRLNIEAGQKFEALKEPTKSLKKKMNTCDNINSNELRTYQQVSDKYGLVFCDLNMDFKLKDPTCELDKLLQSTNYHTLPKPNIYPMQAITKIACNPNKKSFLYYASGYQVGLLRVSTIRFLCPENV